MSAGCTQAGDINKVLLLIQNNGPFLITILSWNMIHFSVLTLSKGYFFCNTVVLIISEKIGFLIFSPLQLKKHRHWSNWKLPVDSGAKSNWQNYSVGKVEPKLGATCLKRFTAKSKCSAGNIHWKLFINPHRLLERRKGSCRVLWTATTEDKEVWNGERYGNQQGLHRVRSFIMIGKHVEDSDTRDDKQRKVSLLFFSFFFYFPHKSQTKRSLTIGYLYGTSLATFYSDLSVINYYISWCTTTLNFCRTIDTCNLRNWPAINASY